MGIHFGSYLNIYPAAAGRYVANGVDTRARIVRQTWSVRVRLSAAAPCDYEVLGGGILRRIRGEVGS